jgi:hypothetical protein
MNETTERDVRRKALLDAVTSVCPWCSIHIAGYSAAEKDSSKNSAGNYIHYNHTRDQVLLCKANGIWKLIEWERQPVNLSKGEDLF